jgi:hypothetical protein
MAHQPPAPVKVHAGSAMSSGMWGGFTPGFAGSTQQRFDAPSSFCSRLGLPARSAARKKILLPREILFEHFVKIVEIIPLCVRKL